jgi:hypothetical protein
VASASAFNQRGKKTIHSNIYTGTHLAQIEAGLIDVADEPAELEGGPDGEVLVPVLKGGDAGPGLFARGA